MHVIHSIESFQPPLIIYAYENDNEECEFKYEGYHFLISEMEKYEKLFNLSNWYNYIIYGYYSCIIIILFLTFYFLINILFLFKLPTQENKAKNVCILN